MLIRRQEGSGWVKSFTRQCPGDRTDADGRKHQTQKEMRGVLTLTLLLCQTVSVAVVCSSTDPDFPLRE